MIREGEDFVLGFADESAQHINVSTSRVWSLGKPVRKVNSDRIHANTFGFYAMNGESVILIPDCSKSADMCAFLYAVRKANGDRKVVMILDNGPIHHSNAVIFTAEVMDIALVFALLSFLAVVVAARLVAERQRHRRSETVGKAGEHVRDP